MLRAHGMSLYQVVIFFLFYINVLVIYIIRLHHITSAKIPSNS